MKKSINISLSLLVILVFVFSAFGASRNVSSSKFENVFKNKQDYSRIVETAKTKCASKTTQRDLIGCISALVSFIYDGRDVVNTCTGVIPTQSCVDAVDAMIASMERVAGECGFLIEDEPVSSVRDVGRLEVLALLDKQKGSNKPIEIKLSE